MTIFGLVNELRDVGIYGGKNEIAPIYQIELDQVLSVPFVGPRISCIDKGDGRQDNANDPYIFLGQKRIKQ